MSDNYKEKIIKAFDQAEHYDQFARIQKIVAKKLSDRIFHYFNSISASQPLSILEIGCGTGFLTEHLVRLFPDAHIVVTDISPKMLQRSKDKLNKSKRNVTFKIMDGEHPDLDGQYDLICSSLTLQWFSDLSISIKNLTNLLKVNGYFICSTLASDTFKEWRAVHMDNHFDCSLQNYPQFTDLQSLWPLTGSGYWESEEIIDHYDNGLDFAKELHAIGAFVPDKKSYPLQWSQFKKVIADFNCFYCCCTYHIAYGVFHKFSAKGFFVTGTDTDVGKTFISTLLTKLLNGIYWKPIQTGLSCDQGDTKTVCQLAEISSEHYLPPLIELQAPLSPEEAAKLEQYEIKPEIFNGISLNPEKKYIVEGAGGVLVPIAKHYLMIDLMKTINLPVIIVARTKLGTLNHTLMTIEVLRNKKITIAGVILNGALNKTCKEFIESYGKVKILGEIPQLPDINSEKLNAVYQYISIPEDYL